MTRLGLGFAMIALAAAAAAAQDGDAVAIKVAYPRAGQRAKVTVEDRTSTKYDFTVMGKAQGKEEIKTKSLVYIDEIIENPKNEKKATKLKRTYEKAVLGRDGNSGKLPIEGKTIAIEKKDGKYQFALDGQPLTGDSLKLLEDEFNKSDQKDTRDVMFPKMPVKPGETWTIPSEEMLKAIGTSGPIFDKDKVAATGKLVKAYRKDGRQYGVMEFVFEGPLKGLGEKSPITVKDGKMTLTMTGDGCIDGSAATGSSVSKTALTMTGTTQGIELKIVVDGVEKRTMEELPKK